MIRIAVLDNEKEDIENISRITAQCMRDMGITYQMKTYDRPGNLVYDLQCDITFDIFLLDVEMEEMTGIEVAREIRKKDFEAVIIYVTNYVEYAIDAYEVNAYRYIPKRLLAEKLPTAYEILLDLLEKKWKECFVIEKHHQLERIPYNEIYYLKKDGKNTLIAHKHGISSIRMSISDALGSMNRSRSFLMVDKSYAVNGWHVMSLKDQQVVLRDGSVIPVSGPRLKQVKTELMRYWR